MADSAIITDPAGVTTSIRANASSPVFKVGAGSNAQFTLSLTDRLKPNTLTTELLILPSSTAALPGAAGATVKLLDYATMTQAGYAIGVTRLGSNNVWSAEIAGQRIAKDVVAARVATDKWAHVL